MGSLRSPRRNIRVTGMNVGAAQQQAADPYITFVSGMVGGAVMAPQAPGGCSRLKLPDTRHCASATAHVRRRRK